MIRPGVYIYTGRYRSRFKEGSTMSIAILTEGGKQMGFGHVTRCLSLYQAFENRGFAPEFFISGDISIQSVLGNCRFRLLDWVEDIEEILPVVRDAEIVLVDSYLASETVINRIAEQAKEIAFLDDTARMEYPKGFVINWSIGATDLDYREKENVRYLLGPKYISLREPFWKVPEREFHEEVQRVMLSFGGDDSKDITPKALTMLVWDYPDLKKSVVVGNAFNNIESIEVAADENTEFIYAPDAGGMKRVMSESDIAICSGGQTVYELARVGVPAVVVSVADNQVNNVKAWERTGFIENAGKWTDEKLFHNISNKFKILMDPERRREAAASGRRTVPGKGAHRLINTMRPKARPHELGPSWE